MSMKPQPLRPVPESVRRVAESVLRPDDRMRIIGDRMGQFVRDEDFADLFSAQGRPALSPSLLLMVTLLQFVENLSDRAAARMTAVRLDWKYALHLPLSYPGFDPSVLSEFRERLERREGEGARRALERLLAKLVQMGLLKAGGTQRTDSLSVLAAVRDLTRLERVMETLRLALVALEKDVHGLAWLQRCFAAERLGEWAERYGSWTREERLVREEGERGRREVQRLAGQTGEDAQALLEALAQPDTPEPILRLSPVVVLKEVLHQQYERTPDGMRWRTKVLATREQTVSTPHDPQARWSTKRGREWIGYKLQLTETVQQGQPRLITDVQTDPATAHDAQQLAGIQQRLDARGLLPQEHLADTAYITGENMARSQALGVELVGPALPDVSPQARIEGGLTQAHFTIDAQNERVYCPGGAVSASWLVVRERGREHDIHVAFSARDCGRCALYERCVVRRSPPEGTGSQETGSQETGSQGASAERVGRHLRLAEHYALIHGRRQEQGTPAFKERYRKRAGVEASLSEGVRAHGLRRARYVGLARVRVQHLLSAAAMNLKRAARWLAGIAREEERAPGLATLRNLRTLGALGALGGLPAEASP